MVVVTSLACGRAPPPVASLDWLAAPEPTAAPERQLPRLRVEGARLARATDGVTTSLVGVNVCSLEFDATGANFRVDERGSLTLQTLAAPARWGANAVRVPVNQQWFLERPDYVERIERLLDEANALGLYVLLDVQWEHGERTEPYHLNILELPTFGPGNTTEAFWLAATSRWSNRSNLLYDLVNEPHGHSDEDTAAAMQALVDAIRRRDQQAVVVVAGMNWAHTLDHYRRHPLQGANLVYATHQYLPYDQPDGFQERFGRASATLPVLVSEFHADPAEGDYAQRLVDFAEGASVDGWMPWAVGCGFELDDDRTREPLMGLARRMQEWPR